MKSKRKKAISSIAADIESFESDNIKSDFNAVQSLVDCCININNDNKRKKAITEIIAKSENVRQLMESNPALVRAEIEQALIKAATGYSVTEKKIKYINGVRTVETVTKQIAPSQAAIEFFLVNKAGDSYARNPDVPDADGSGKIEEIMEALRNVK